MHSIQKTTDPIYLSIIFRLTAVNSRVAAETLSATLEVKENGCPSHARAIPFYYLASLAAELFLKSALLKRGFVESDIKKANYRHNLKNLLGAAQQQGLSITPETTWLIDGLHEQDGTHALRYTALVDDGQPTFMPPPALVFAMLDELLMLTRVSRQGM